LSCALAEWDAVSTQRPSQFIVDESRLDRGRMKGESNVDVDQGQTELVAVDVLRLVPVLCSPRQWRLTIFVL
jgi:hypothetical protein